MSNPWLSIPLEEYEGHMDSAGVDQLGPLAELFKCALDSCVPESVAILGVAGGNGLEQIDSTVTKTVVGVDVNPCYLHEAQRRFATLSGLQLHCCDLTDSKFSLASVLLVHAALIFEHVGLGVALDNALSLVAAGGSFSVVLQLPSEQESGVACTRYTSMQTLKNHFRIIDPHELQRLLDKRGFHLVKQKTRMLPAGKALWLGIFARDTVCV